MGKECIVVVSSKTYNDLLDWKQSAIGLNENKLTDISVSAMYTLFKITKAGGYGVYYVPRKKSKNPLVKLLRCLRIITPYKKHKIIFDDKTYKN